MRTPRIYHPENFNIGESVNLNHDAANHVGRVLRLAIGNPITLFNGDGNNYNAELTEVGKKQVVANIQQCAFNHSESPLNIHLGQVISRGDRMDITLQKSVELGVNKITPLFSKRCGVKLSGERLEKRINQWQKIVIAACEQSGRSIIPTVEAAQNLDDWLQQQTDDLKLTLDPQAEMSLSSLPVTTKQTVRLLIGPEGGLNEQEITNSHHQGFQAITLGPRILRTETAALTVISILQSHFGDLG